MTEAEWLEGRSPGALLWRVVLLGMSDRKARLLACACCRQVRHVVTSEKIEAVVRIAERYADGQASGDERKEAWQWARKCDTETEVMIREVDAGGWREDLHVHAEAVRLATVALTPPADFRRYFDIGARPSWIESSENDSRSGLIRDIFANPFRPIAHDAAWLSEDVYSLAAAAYDNRILPRGELERDRLAVLSDALEEAGCTDAAILDHLRSPGPHVRGCWALDLILGKS